MSKNVHITEEGHAYAFLCNRGQELQSIDRIMELAESKRSNLSWLGAARLSCIVSGRVARDCLRAMGAGGKTGR